ncbi:MAG: hypothetical protein BKP49_09640 [Treponema sp. CETP13]|nr:MAG: hypothetical protein BKP49_09640 [Treponema sp. CETP13]
MGDNDCFLIFDVSDPSTPKKINSLEMDVEAFAIKDNYAYIPNCDRELAVVDLTIPNRAHKVLEVYIGNCSRDICINGNYAYIANLYDGLIVVDISDPRDAKEAGRSIDSDTYVRYTAVAVKDNYAFLAKDGESIAILEISPKGDSL